MATTHKTTRGSKAEPAIVVKTKEDLIKLRERFLKFKKTGVGGNVLIHAFKYVSKSGTPPYNALPDFRPYQVGHTYYEPRADKSNRSCAPGLNVASRAWCVRDGGTRDYRNGNLYLLNAYNKLMLVAFRVKDIASIPVNDYGSRRPLGKFRLTEMRVERIFKQSRPLRADR